jgi:glycosyltransferase involved in cell wall biosynthesis
MPAGWRRAGVEEDAEAAARAIGRGIEIIARDLSDPEVQELAGAFDLVLAIGVLQRAPDLRVAATNAAALMSDDGLMLIELPLAQETGPDSTSLEARLGLVRHPTRSSIERLFRTELGFQLSGTECVIEGHGSTYVGFVARLTERAKLARDLVDRVLTGPLTGLRTDEERRVRALYQAIHRADTSEEGRQLLAVLRQPGALAATREETKRPPADDPVAIPAAQDGLPAQLRDVEDAITRIQLDNAGRHEGLRSEIARGELADIRRHQELRTEIDRSLARIERRQRDGIAHRLARLARGSGMIARRATSGGGFRTVLSGTRLLTDPAARRTWADMFDADEYLDAYADIEKANVPPALHYLLLGYQEGREPSERFSGTAYLTANRDVMKAGMNPLLHFALRGQREGRPISRPRLARKPAAPRRINSLWPPEAPLVSVVIPCFNYGRSLRDAVESVLAQTWEDLEVIVVEGGSTDADSLAAVRELEAAGLPRTAFLYRDQRHLVGDNRNYGISRARGRYIVCLDPDDELERVYLEVALFLAEAYGLDLVYPSVQCFGESDVTWFVGDTSFADMLRGNSIPTVALFRRSAWVEAGGFRDWGTGASHVPEDWAFWTRLVGMGYRTKAIHQPLMRYHVHAGSLSATSLAGLDEYRPIIQAANADLLEGLTTLPYEPEMRESQQAYGNLLARGPSGTGKGSVLIAMPYATVGGAERLMASLAESLQEDGHRAIVVTTSTLPENTPDGLSVFRAFTRHVYALPDLFVERQQQESYLLFLLRRYQVETILIVGSRLVYELLPEIRRTTPGIGVVDQLFNAVGHTPSHAEFAPFIDLAVVPSMDLKRQLEVDWKATADVSVIPHAVHVRDVPVEHAQASVEPAAGRPAIGYFGRWSEEKGPDLFVEVCRAVAQEADAAFIMTGDGPMHDEVTALIARYGLRSRVRTLGFVSDAAPVIAGVDVVVVPSRLDGMPLVILEAMALGKPIVASAVGSIPEVIEDQRTGFLCPPGDSAAFAARVLALMRDDALRERIGAAAGREYAENYSWQRAYHLYLDAFEKAATLASGRTAVEEPSRQNQ